MLFSTLMVLFWKELMNSCKSISQHLYNYLKRQNQIQKPNDDLNRVRRSVARNFINQCDECRESRRILGEVCTCRIVNPEESLSPLENIARLSIKLRIGTDLKPRRIVEMRAHELKREDAYTNCY